MGNLDGSRQSACDDEFDGGLRSGRQQFRLDVPKGRLDERINGIGLSVPRRAFDELKTRVIKRDKSSNRPKKSDSTKMKQAVSYRRPASSAFPSVPCRPEQAPEATVRYLRCNPAIPRKIIAETCRGQWAHDCRELICVIPAERWLRVELGAGTQPRPIHLVGPVSGRYGARINSRGRQTIRRVERALSMPRILRALSVGRSPDSRLGPTGEIVENLLPVIRPHRNLVVRPSGGAPPLLFLEQFGNDGPPCSVFALQMLVLRRRNRVSVPPRDGRCGRWTK